MANLSRRYTSDPGADAKTLFWTPAELGSNWVKFAQGVRENSGGVTWGVQRLDEHIIPLRAGKLWAIVARPGHGKSTLAAYLARREAQRLQRTGDGRGIVVYVSLDQPVEEVYSIVRAQPGMSATDLAWGRADPEQMVAAAASAVSEPLWMLGKSVVDDRRQPPMTYETIYSAIRDIAQEYKHSPTLVIIDYIQIFDPLRGQSRAESVTESVYKARRLALDCQCGVIMCVQASRAVDDRAIKIPLIADCQWSSAVEQEADAIISVWRPCLTERDAEVEIGQHRYPVKQELLVLALQKQRMARADKIFILHLDPSLARLADIEYQREASAGREGT